MPIYTFPDGRQVDSSEPQSGFDLAMDIAEGLARRSIAVELDGSEILDLNRPITKDATVRLLTVSNDDPAALSVLRHSCAHVLAEAICELYPGTKLAYGPSIDDGFFYDLSTPEPISDADFEKIEAVMKRIVKEKSGHSSAANLVPKRAWLVLKATSTSATTPSGPSNAGLTPLAFIKQARMKPLGKISVLARMYRIRDSSQPAKNHERLWCILARGSKLGSIDSGLWHLLW